MTGAVHHNENIAIIQLARFGDLVQTSALLQNLKKEADNKRRITLFVDERNFEIASLLRCVDKVIPIPLKNLPNNIKASITTTLVSFRSWYQGWYDGTTYDSLILLNQGDLPSAIGQLIKSKKRSGPFNGKEQPLPHKYLSRALADRSCNPVNLYEIWAAYGPRLFPLPLPALKNNVLGTPFAVTSIEDKLRASKNNNIAINLGAGAAGRTLVKEKLAVLIHLIMENSSDNVVLLGQKSESSTAEYLLNGLEELEKGRVFDFTGKTSVAQLASLLGAVLLLVTADTGTIHLAAAAGTKILGLFFAGANPLETGPYSKNAIVLVHKQTLDQDENKTITDPMNLLDMAKVYELMQNQINEEVLDKEIEDGFDPFVLYVARPAPVGVEYRSLNKKDNLPFGKAQRWLPEIRRKIWGEKIQVLQDGSVSEPWKTGGNGIAQVEDIELKRWLTHVFS